MSVTVQVKGDDGYRVKVLPDGSIPNFTVIASGINDDDSSKALMHLAQHKLSEDEGQSATGAAISDRSRVACQVQL